MFDPISLGISAIGLGLQVWSGMESSSAAKESYEAQNKINAEEGQIQALKQRQAQLEARRMQTENMRNIQRGRAMASQAAVNQGAQFGTGLQGGLAQVQAQGFWNMLGVDQAQEIGNTIAGHNQTISGLKTQVNNAQSDMATSQGYASIGGALLKAGPSIGSFAQGFGSQPANIGTFNGNFGQAPQWNTYG
jgi:hypothetical protein